MKSFAILFTCTYKYNSANKEINSLQTNNLEVLNRIKRQNENNNRRILRIDEELIIDENNRISYIDSCARIFVSLRDNRILRPAINFSPANTTNYESLDNILFVITPEESRQYDYLIIPVIVVQSNGNNRDLELVFRTSDFYLEGFILQNNYYHFSDSHITEINNINSTDLQLDSAYRSILPEEDQNIHWQQIFNSFNTLTEMGTNNQALNNILSASLANVILVTAEAMRFRYIFNLIRDNLINNDNYITWGRSRNNDIYNTVVKWRKTSRNTISDINLNIFSINYKDNEDMWNQGAFTRELQKRLDKTSIESIKEMISNTNIRILLYAILKDLIIKKSCDPSSSKSRKSRDLKDDVWTEKFCSLNPQVSKITGDIKLIKIINENTENDNLEEAYIYVLTTESLYLIYNNEVYKLNNFNQKIDDFWLDDKRKAFIKSNDLEYPVNFYKLENTIFLTIIKNLNEIITNSNLGALNDNNNQTIINAVKTKNNLANLTYTIRNKTNNSAEIWIDSDNDYYQKWSWEKVYFTIKQNLLTDFKSCIDPVNDSNDETILAAVKAKNPNLDTSQVYVKQKVINGRLELGVKSTSNKYNTTSGGHCDNFTVRQNISNIITNTQLGSLNNNNKDTILNAVKTKNPNLDTSQVGVSRITDTSADIDGSTYYNSNKYQGYKTVYFTNKKCSFKEIFLTPVWDNWYRLIPLYDAYHAIECI